MTTKKLSAGLAIAVLTAGLALPAQAQKEEASALSWLGWFWNWFGVSAATETGNPIEHEMLEAGVAADPFGRAHLVIPGETETDEADAGVAADPFG